MTDINGSKVPIFVDKKVNDVYTVEESAQNDRIGYVTMSLILVSNERQVTRSRLEDEV